MPPSPSTRQQIIEVFRARLLAIAAGAQFETDAGATVFVNETPALGPDDPATAIAVVIGEDIPSRSGEHTILELPIEIHALANADLDAPWVAVEAVLADIKRAIELPDRSLGGLVKARIERGSTRTLEREDGSTTVGAGITYLVPYAEVWGDP
jgi:hypothetical protein